jgi:IS5 family transposase
MVTDAEADEGTRLRVGLLDKTNTAAIVRADSAYRSAANEDFLARNNFVSRIHRKKPPGKPMPERTRQANAEKSRVRSCIEHVFAAQKFRMWLFVRTIGIARAMTEIGIANLVFNLKRFVFLQKGTFA